MKPRTTRKRLISFTLSLLMALPFIVSEGLMSLTAHALNIEEGYYFIKHPSSGKYVDVTDMDTENGKQLQIYDKYQYHTNQVFKFERVDSGFWKITSLYNGKCMEVRNDGQKNNDKVAQWDYGNIACQQWEIISLSNGNIGLKNRNSGKLLNTYQAKSANGTKLVQYEQNTKNSKAQEFQLEALAVGADDAKAQRAQHERECYNYLKQKGLNNAACAGILASMYAENKFVFGTEALNFYWTGVCEPQKIAAAIGAVIASTLKISTTLTTLQLVDNSADGAATAASVFTEGKQKRYFSTLSQDFHNAEKNNAATLAANGFWPVYGLERFEWPIHNNDNKLYCTSKYGTRTDPINGSKSFHSGMDLTLFDREITNGSPVYPSASGTVVRSQYNDGGYGHYIVIYHEQTKLYTLYGHLSKRNVNPGDYVNQNDVIGLVGSTGRSTGPHLHFEVRYKLDIGKTTEEQSANTLPAYNFINEGMAISPYEIKPQTATQIDTYIEGRKGSKYNITFKPGEEMGGNPQPGIQGVYLTVGDVYLREGPGTQYNDIDVIYKGTEVEVSEFSGIWGKTILKGKTGWFSTKYARYLRPLELIKKPNAPSLSLASAADVALNVISTVSWGAVDGADSYTVTVYNEAGAEVVKQEGIKATSTCFTLNDVGSYTVKAVAVNSKYTSDVATLAQKITVHPNSTVIFLSDPEGTELSKQSVPYNADAVVPETPTKKGFTFIGWDGNYTAVKEDTTITAKWQRNKYNVNFYNGTGSTLDSQRVYYEDAAVEPQAPTMEGYVFQGWDKKFEYIEDNLDVYPIFAWGNADLPVIISDVSAVRDSDGYNVTYSLKNAPGQSTSCRLVISLKTAEGKLITYTESNAYNLREESVITDSQYVPSQEVASIVEINAVRRFALVIPIAEKQSGEVTGEAFTNWSTEKPPVDATKVEQQKEYRYRTKTIKTSDEKLPSPWVLEEETTGYTEWGEWSKFDEPYVAKSDTRDVDTTQEPRSEHTGYQMFFYCTQDDNYPHNRWYSNKSIAGNLSGNGARESYGEHYGSMVVTTDQLNSAAIVNKGDWFYGSFRGINKGTEGGYQFSFDPSYLWYRGEAVYNNISVTLYRYRDRTKIPLYTYSQLSDYSAWSTEKPEESDDKVIEERTVYRYVPSDANMIENTDGEKRTISGSVDPSFAGKQAILFVYKIDEAADYTNEAVAQTVIGENGEYSFEFKLREEPTSMNVNGEKKPTGDFTVTLGIEGTSSVIFLDPIKAPTPEYTVEYVDHDGKVLLTTKVKDGEAAPIPEKIPERKGYTFAGWNNNPSEIHSNMTMTAVYVANKYTVAFVDWNSESVVFQQYTYGNPILPPEPKCPEGYEFKGWDILLDGKAIVTENVVATAVFEPKQYEVSFVDYEGKVIATHTVKHGNTVELPDALEDLEDRSFVCWSIGEDTIITESMVVKPIILYSETAATPVVSLDTNAYDSSKKLEITTSDNSKIYYTLDGSDPSENGIEYTGAITITNSCIFNCVAKATNKNNSELVTRLYAINSSDATTDYMAYDLLPEYVKKNAADYNVMSTTGYRYLMKKEVTSKKQYESLLSAGWETESETWSDWSEWMPTLSGTADLMIEQKSKDAEPIDMPFYQYSHWKYFDEENATYKYSATPIEGVECVKESIDSPERLPVASLDNGVSSYSYNGQTWFNQTSITKSVVPEEKVYQYRSKTVKMTKLSDWVENLPEGETATEEGEVYCYREPARYILTVNDENGSQLYNDLAFADALIDLKAMQLDRAGYTLDGLYTTDNQKWNIEKDTITKNLTLTAKYTPIQYKVTFVDEDIVLSEKTVDCFSYAAPPEMYSKEGLVFAGWDSDDYTNVTKDLTITAKYIPNEDAPSLTLEKSKYYLYPNTQTTLSVMTANIDAESETIIWTSMNPEIVSVSDDGVLSAKKAGETNIVVTEASTGLVSVCTVSVYNNPQQNPGDVNEDGSVDLKDVVIMSRALAGGWDLYLNENNADVNKDSSFDLKDVTLVRRYLAGWDVTLA